MFLMFMKGVIPPSGRPCILFEDKLLRKIFLWKKDEKISLGYYIMENLINYASRLMFFE